MLKSIAVVGGVIVASILLNVLDEHTTRAAFQRQPAAAPDIAGAVVSLGLAEELSALAYAAQDQPTALLRWSCAECPAGAFALVDDFFFRPANIFGFVARQEVADGEFVLHVVFRGTEPKSLDNWAQNLQTGMVAPFAEHEAVQVHAGWWRSYVEVMPQVRHALRAGLDSVGSRGVVGTHFAGHSLGGALATLSMKFMYTSLHVPVCVHAHVHVRQLHARCTRDRALCR